MNLEKNLIKDIDSKMLKLGYFLEAHPERAPEVLRISAWLVKLRKEVSS